MWPNSTHSVSCLLCIVWPCLSVPFFPLFFYSMCIWWSSRQAQTAFSNPAHAILHGTHIGKFLLVAINEKHLESNSGHLAELWTLIITQNIHPSINFFVSFWHIFVYSFDVIRNSSRKVLNPETGEEVPYSSIKEVCVMSCHFVCAWAKKLNQNHATWKIYA